jgi:hypothetical protein
MRLRSTSNLENGNRKTPYQEYYEDISFKSSYFFSPFIVRSSPTNFIRQQYCTVYYYFTIRREAFSDQKLLTRFKSRYVFYKKAVLRLRNLVPYTEFSLTNVICFMKNLF